MPRRKLATTASLSTTTSTTVRASKQLVMATGTPPGDDSSELSSAPASPSPTKAARKPRAPRVRAEEGVETATSDAPAAPKPKRRRSVKVKVESEVPADVGAETTGDAPAVVTKPKRKRTAKAIVDTEMAAEVDADTTGDTPPVPKPKRKRTAKAKVDPEPDAVETEGLPKPKRKRIAKAKVGAEVDENADTYSDDAPKPKRKRTMKPKEPIVYDIPDVIRKETTFRGRLGYACLNTVLRSIKPAADSIFASRTCRIDTIEKNGLEFVKELALRNVQDLYKMVEWNEVNNIRFMRMSSEIFPFSSHAKYGYTLEYADKELKAVGDLARKYGHRLTTHPGQFTQIGSPTNKVVDASVRELEYHCEMMDRMGLGSDGVMIIHMGGVYGDKPATIARFKENYTTRLSENIKKRLVLENDEICYNLDDIMPICSELHIPIVVDYHHDWINPSSQPLSELIPIINETWTSKGIKPKQHLSEPRPGAVSVMERRAHADRCQSLPDALPDDMDLMIEAKDKEQAVFELYRIYGLAPVIHENLRPPNPEPTLATNGRKNTSPKKKKKEADAEAEAADALESIEEGIVDEAVDEDEAVPIEPLTDSPLSSSLFGAGPAS